MYDGSNINKFITNLVYQILVNFSKSREQKLHKK